MKSKTKQYAWLLTGVTALMMTSSVMADEEVVEPQIAICDIAVSEPIADDKSADDDMVMDDKALDQDVVIDQDDSVVDDDEVMHCWDLDWVKRDNDGEVTNPEILYMTSNGPTENPTSGEVQPSAPQSADEQSAMTAVKKNSISANIRRVAAKPSAVKTNGRVFIR